jgi:hypothetical protein
MVVLFDNLYFSFFIFHFSLIWASRFGAFRASRRAMRGSLRSYLRPHSRAWYAASRAATIPLASWRSITYKRRYSLKRTPP